MLRTRIPQLGDDGGGDDNSSSSSSTVEISRSTLSSLSTLSTPSS